MITVLSFGYLHGPAPEAELTIDTRRFLRDPARVRSAGLLDSTGLNQVVRDMVMNTPGARDAATTAADFTAALVESGKPAVVAVGCAGGRHRSVALAEEIAKQLREVWDYPVTVRHLHIHLPRVLRDTTSETHSTGA
ncbi:RapZ C-terminal domain-containing protein [Actinosynnema pretiosum]|uniref:RapZ C-terminal domain-containing protein n=1 Tax=Actinosynnema pretiosum TaxID=42197 RepID=A0A290Z3P1_9PSEU|nr:RNase adapter RapZ [Actinosynnema pretiosum]ATE53612.1 hypothetical protein CNX65_10175 [Actinosynnema pretiosum]